MGKGAASYVEAGGTPFKAGRRRLRIPTTGMADFAVDCVRPPGRPRVPDASPLRPCCLPPRSPSRLPLVARAADPHKVLRIAFPDVSLLDPQQLTDLYSSRVVAAVFEGLYEYQYLSDPARIVPNTAEGMPELTEGGRVWTIRVKRGIRFADHPAFGGKPRELTAHDYVYSLKRWLDPTLKAGGEARLTDLLVGARAVVDAARTPGGRFDYDAPIAGLRAVDAYTLRLELQGSRLHDPRGARPRAGVRGRARGGRGLGRRSQRASGRHGALPCGRVEARVAARARGGARLSRRHVPAGRRSRAQAACRVHGGCAAPCHRPHRARDHRGGSARDPGLRAGRPRLRAPHGCRRAPAAPGRQGAARPRAARRAPRALRGARAHLHVLQHGRRRGRRHGTGAHRAAPRDRHGVQHARDDPRALRRRRDSRRAAAAAGGDSA